VNYVEITTGTAFEPSTPRSDKYRTRQTREVAATKSEVLC
jgi:hypothetical protein